MKVDKQKPDTYILTNLKNLDPVTVYVTNYETGKGKIVIECFGSAWAFSWGGMGERSLQEFFISCNNDYILNKLLKTTTQTDFDAINDAAKKKGFDICVTSDVEVAMQYDQMTDCFGTDWFMDLPTCSTHEYKYLDGIVNAVKEAFKHECEVVASTN